MMGYHKRKVYWTLPVDNIVPSRSIFVKWTYDPNNLEVGEAAPACEMIMVSKEWDKENWRVDTPDGREFGRVALCTVKPKPGYGYVGLDYLGLYRHHFVETTVGAAYFWIRRK